MLYNKSHLSRLPLNTAGKITILTAVVGLAVFVIAFLFNVGSQELQRVEAQNQATTTITVLNTPPVWQVDPVEFPASATATPTNSGDDVTWIGTASDGNGADYYLLICSGTSTPTTPTANTGAAPNCAPNQIQWAVSTATISGTQATAATTTRDRTAPGSFAESNIWYAWVCDGDASPRCNTEIKQGDTATNSSPFMVNSRPSFTVFADDSPTIPGGTVNFTSTALDADSVGGNDTVQLVVCATSSYNNTTNTCDGTTLATSTFAASDPTAIDVIDIPTQDDDYQARGYIVDEHGHEAIGATQGSDSVLTVDNVAPTVASSTIDLNGGLDLTLTQEAAETTGFTLSYTVTDNNSCLQAASAGGGDEIVNYNASIYRSGVGSSSCDAFGDYNPNNCYTSQRPTTTWNLVCAASSTTCSGSDDATQLWECTFPLWYIADPTDATTTTVQFEADDWRAAVDAVDDDGASTTILTQSNTADIEVQSFLAFALDTLSIAYTDLEPGQRTDPLSASTTVRATGNVGLDQRLTGEAMCGTYTPSTECPNSASSTIPETQQVFATSSIAYGTASSSGNFLSSSTDKELEVNIPKSTATSTQAATSTFWGIEVPSVITLAGLYTGQNTFIGIVGESSDW